MKEPCFHFWSSAKLPIFSSKTKSNIFFKNRMTVTKTHTHRSLFCFSLTLLVLPCVSINKHLAPLTSKTPNTFYFHLATVFFSPPPFQFELHARASGRWRQGGSLTNARCKPEKGKKKKKTTHAIHWSLYWFTGVLKRSLVMPLPKHTNLLDQVCQNIDWEEVQRPPLCFLQRGAGLWNRITRGHAGSERMSITFCLLIQRVGNWDVIEMLKTRGMAVSKKKKREKHLLHANVSLLMYS